MCDAYMIIPIVSFILKKKRFGKRELTYEKKQNKSIQFLNSMLKIPIIFNLMLFYFSKFKIFCYCFKKKHILTKAKKTRGYTILHVCSSFFFYFVIESFCLLTTYLNFHY